MTAQLGISHNLISYLKALQLKFKGPSAKSAEWLRTIICKWTPQDLREVTLSLAPPFSKVALKSRDGNEPYVMSERAETALERFYKMLDIHLIVNSAEILIIYLLSWRFLTSCPQPLLDCVQIFKEATGSAQGNQRGRGGRGRWSPKFRTI